MHNIPIVTHNIYIYVYITVTCSRVNLAKFDVWNFANSSGAARGGCVQSDAAAHGTGATESVQRWGDVQESCEFNMEIQCYSIYIYNYIYIYNIHIK